MRLLDLVGLAILIAVILWSGLRVYVSQPAYRPPPPMNCLCPEAP